MVCFKQFLNIYIPYILAHWVAINDCKFSLLVFPCLHTPDMACRKRRSEEGIHNSGVYVSFHVSNGCYCGMYPAHITRVTIGDIRRGNILTLSRHQTYMPLFLPPPQSGNKSPPAPAS
ncbi:uncharacterized protein MCYG_08056 [Microsporum canis CBS 113480]|uniref:Uncharacterized protein n=1 Tax=Arthroderma otae (strain ATCC MYA-4605 / CBS 113480) TaxID=554155 RepID=C5FZD4_ARTOC|nr:uncharacterized protein MCYG_08056 [Microsporum canis CBS 113480]EEQ35237.1 predicted protein [Microsporum canis CBS 113480]